jgi:hypothetical protein
MKFTRKFVVIGAVTALGAVGGVAFAYWTTTGSGSGTATAATSAGNLTLHAVFDNDLTPGASETLTVTADNGTDSGLTIAGKTLAFTVATDKVGCTSADFSIANATADAAVLVAANSTSTEVGHSTLEMLDRAVNQDACKGAVITVSVSVS